MNDLFTLLDGIQLLSDDLREHLHKVFLTRHIHKRDFLVSPDRINNYVYFVQEGLVRCYYLKKGASSKQDREVSAWFLKEGDFISFSERSFKQGPIIEYMQALESCTVYYISFQERQNLYAAFPEFNLHGRILAEKYGDLWYCQLRGLKMQTVLERYQFLLDHFPELLQRVPAKYLASYLSTTEATLSRIRKKR